MSVPRLNTLMKPLGLIANSVAFAWLKVALRMLRVTMIVSPTVKVASSPLSRQPLLVVSSASSCGPGVGVCAVARIAAGHTALVIKAPISTR